MHIRNTGVLVIGVMSIALSGCIGSKSINYLNDPSLSNGSSKLFENRKFEYRLQVNDVLSIRVMGLDDATSKFFNVESQANGSMVTDAAMYVNGYSVDKNGQVQLPTVGKIKVQGLTIGEAQELVQRKKKDFKNNATVNLKMVNWR